MIKTVMKKQKQENEKAVTSSKEQTACTNATTTELSDPSDSSKQKKSNTKTYWILFYTFLKIGAFTFGGGYAMIPLIQKEIVEKRRWISSDTVLEIIAIAESTPGPIAVNTATFVGYRIGGFWGALFATVGIVLPSFFVILAISYVLQEFSHIKAIQYAFFGIRAGVLALILQALFSISRQTKLDILSWIIMGAAFILVAFLGVDTLIVILGCALFGVVSSAIRMRRNRL